MSRKTLILRRDQLDEICGTNTAYLDNSGDYAEDGLTTTKAGGAVSDSNGEKEYSDPLTTDDYAHELAPETLFALLFRNGGHGLWGHWGSGLRANTLDGFDNEFEYHDGWDDEDENNEWEDEYDDEEKDFDESDPDEIRAEIKRLLSLLHDIEGEDSEEEEEDFDEDDDFGKKKLQESNGELEGRTWRLDLDGDGLKKTYSYTNLTTKKTELERLLANLKRQDAPRRQLERVKHAIKVICSVLNRETGAIRQRKTNRKNLGFENQFQKAGGTKNSGNGKAHSKKVKDPNVGTGFITYA